jgi:hypothetical protein
MNRILKKLGENKYFYILNIKHEISNIYKIICLLYKLSA